MTNTHTNVHAGSDPVGVQVLPLRSGTHAVIIRVGDSSVTFYFDDLAQLDKFRGSIAEAREN